MYQLLLWTIAAVVSTCLALPSSHVLHERRDTKPHEWIKRSLVPRDVLLPVRIGLRQNNLDRGYDLLMEISDPASPRYSQHYTPEEVIELFAPSEDAVYNVRSWLVSAGFPSHSTSQSANKQWIQFEASPDDLESLLQSKYYIWEHGPSGTVTLACDEYSVPHHLAEHIDYITPGVMLKSRGASNPKPLRERSPMDRPAGLSSREEISLESRDGTPAPQKYKHCPTFATPECVQALYNVTGENPAIAGNNMGIYSESDDICQSITLQAFFEKIYPKIPADTRPEFLSVDSPSREPKGGIEGECDLDMLMAYPLIYPQNLTIYRVNDLPSLKHGSAYNKTTHNYNVFGFFNTWLDALDGSYCNYTAYGITGDSPNIDPTYPDSKKGGWHHPLQCGVYKPANVISVSFYNAESFYPARYEKRQCNEYMKLGLQGVSLIFITGDSGAGGGSGTPNPLNGTDCQGPNLDVFVPNFPATCPYVTTVGSTRLPPHSNILDHPEVGAEFSSGGFSNVFPPPDYQKKFVAHYLTKYPPKHKSYSTTNGKNIGKNGGIFNRNGRGYPDVSCIGVNLAIVEQGYNPKTRMYTNKTTISTGGGTSASAPIWAGLITRINAARLKAGKKTVGFINPTLYKHPEAFYDITKNHNYGCANKEDPIGFYAQPGWDPITGLGSPKFPKLMEIFMALP